MVLVVRHGAQAAPSAPVVQSLGDLSLGDLPEVGIQPLAHHVRHLGDPDRVKISRVIADLDQCNHAHAHVWRALQHISARNVELHLILLARLGFELGNAVGDEPFERLDIVALVRGNERYGVAGAIFRKPGSNTIAPSVPLFSI